MSSQLQTITCKGAIVWDPNGRMTIEDIEVEPPQKSEVRIRVLYASLCHTDVSFASGYPLPLFPRVLGHEGVGVIESVGEGVEDLKEGDIVIPTFLGECRECINCKSEKTNLCMKYNIPIHGLMPDMTSRMSVKGQKLYHLFTCSTFAEFTVVNSNYVVKVDPRLAPTHASLLSCGFTTGFGAVWKEASIEKGSTVAIFGLGGVGIGAIVGAMLLGASKIIGVDVNNNKREKAMLFGMTDFINPKENENKTAIELIREMTDGLGVDYSFECSGVGYVANQAFESTVMGRGITIVVGAAVEKFAEVDRISLMLGRTVKGTMFGGIKPHSHLPSIVSKCIDKEIELDEMLTHEVGLEDINKAFDMLKDADCLKVVIKVSKE